ncbi:MAG: DUF6159 family protein [Chryseolinea sp.]
MNAFSRSWNITKLTFSVIDKDRELLGFALLSFVFSTLFSIAMIFPSIVPTLMEEGISEDSLSIFQYAIVFLTYFGLAFIATFFNVCVVYTTKIRFEGGNATFGESIKFAFSRIGLIVQWSLLSATVGLLLRILHNLASRFGKIGQIVANIVIGLLGMAWSIVTIFVVPVLVYEGLGPIDAIKKSAAVIKRTWGESLIKAIGLGLVQFLVFVLIIIGSGVLTYGLASAFDITGLWIGIAVGAGLLLLTGLIFTVANTVFNTALYLYANNGMVAEGFSEEVVKGALKQK